MLARVVLLYFFLIFPLPTSAKVNEHQKSVLKNAVKALLDVKDLPEEKLYRKSTSRTANVASKYMRELYTAYRNGESAEGNIVRSVSPAISVLANGDENLQFDADILKPTEEVVKAEVHFNLRSKRQYEKWKRHDVRLKCYARAGNVSLRLEAVPTTQKTWLAFDARPILAYGRRFGVKFIKVRGNGRRKEMTLHTEKVVRRHAPFLLIFSEDSALFSPEQVISAIHDETPAELPDGDALAHNNRVKREVRPPPSPSYYTYHTGRFGDKDYTLKVRAFQSNGPEVLEDRKEMRRRNRKSRKYRRYRKRKKDYFKDDNLIPYPEDYTKEPFNSRPAWYYGSSSPPPTDPDVFPIPTPEIATNELPADPSGPTVVLLNGEEPHKGHRLTSRPCAVQELNVKFEEIGWGDRIIAPTDFNTNFCAGTCGFPLANPTNHAVVQMVFRGIGLNPHVPEVCCSPDKLDSLTLLYFDGDLVVLKNYPKMIVKSCGCR